MADSFDIRVQGMDDLKAALAEIPSTLRKKVLIKALRAGAKVVLQAARQSVPILQSESPYRTKGLLKKRLTVRTSRVARQSGNVGVFVNVKPADGAKYKTTVTDVLGFKVRRRFLKKASQRGASSKLDPYYWKFVEFGTRKMSARPFLQPAASKLPEALKAFEAEVIPAIEAFNKKGQR